MKFKPCLSGLCLLLLMGCASSPPPRYFTLQDSVAHAPIAGRSPSILITRTALPDMLDRPQMVTRRADHQVVLDEFHRWAEPLQRDIPKVVAAELGRMLGSNRVLSLPIDGQDHDPDFRLQLDVQQLDVIEGRGAHVDLLWQLTPRKGKPVIGRSIAQEAGELSSVTERIAAQRRLLQRVAADIAQQVRALPEQSPQ